MRTGPPIGSVPGGIGSLQSNTGPAEPGAGAAGSASQVGGQSAVVERDGVRDPFSETVGDQPAPLTRPGGRAGCRRIRDRDQ